MANISRYSYPINSLILLLALLLFTACTTDSEPEAASPRSIATATANLQPTPTLVPALQQVESTATTAVLPTADPNEPVVIISAEEPLAPTSADEPAQPTTVPTSTPAPPPNEYLPIAQRNLELRDTKTAQEQFTAILAEPLNQTQTEEALYGLGLAALDEGELETSVAAFQEYLAVALEPNTAVYHYLAQTTADPVQAVRYYQDYIAANPDMGAYIYPLIAALDPTNSTSYYESALTADSHYLVTVNNHRELAARHLNNGNFAGAISQYAAIRDLAQTERTKGEMTYLIGATHQRAGDLPSAYASYQEGIDSYPRAYESYLGLVELVNAEIPVDDYDRGVVDYFAEAYVPGIDALQNYLTRTVGTETPYLTDAHLYLAWSYEGVADYAGALDQLEQYRQTAPKDPEVLGRYIEEKAGMETRSISVSLAINTLTTFQGNNPDHPLAPWAAWRAGVLADRFQQDVAKAIPLYEAYGTAYPSDENASNAWFRVGTLYWEQGDPVKAQSAWETAATYSDNDGRGALFWLISTAEDPTPYLAQVTPNSATDYFSIRTQDLRANRAPYTAVPLDQLQFEWDESVEKAEVEAWFATLFELDTVSSDLPTELQNDGRLVRAEKLWEIGLYEEAKRELEAVRQAYSGNAINSYQLALYFRDIGLYRSSILAAETAIFRSNATVFTAPKLLGRLAYPVYFSDLVVPQAQQYEYDPLLQFSLIRQESLFEGFATSTAYAQGLSQIIPDTGIFVATNLRWEGYENADLYRPYISIIFGSYYLNQQIDYFDNQIGAALAAYNAGPGNAIKWLEIAGTDHDLYLETVNFSETRLYLRQIYRNQAIYRYLYNNPN